MVLANHFFEKNCEKNLSKTQKKVSSKMKNNRIHKTEFFCYIRKKNLHLKLDKVIWHIYNICMKKESTYTVFDISKMMGIKRSTLKQRLERGLIEASVQKAEGQGTKNLFSKQDLYHLVLFQRLFEVGFDQYHASEYSHILLREKLDGLAKVREGQKRYLVFSKKYFDLSVTRIRSETSEHKIVDSLSEINFQDDVLIVVDLWRVKNYVDDLDS